MARLAEQEASRRQQRVITAADDIHRADVLLREGKVDDALALYEAVYNALPAAPLTEETRLVARAGYVQAGVQRAKQLMFEGRRDDANALLGKLLVASPGDQRVVETRKEFDDPDRYPPALTAAHVQRVGEVQKLLVLANSAFEIGDYDKATRAYQDVLRIDATNAAARRGMEAVERAKSQYYKAATDHQRAKMLSEVSRAWEDPVPPSAANLSAMFGAMTAAQTNEKSGRQEIVDKLRAYIMPKVDFAGATISEVVELLRIRSRDLDPTGKGVDFVVNVPEESAGKAISLSMENVPMDEVLRYVTELAGVSYRVEDFAVQITSIGERNSAIITRSFRVPPDFIQNSPAAAVPAGNDPFAAAPAPAGGGLTLRRMGAKEFLESRGVLFPDGTTASFNAATSTLVVRNSIANMEMVEMLVEMASKNAPKMATITVRMIEVNQTNLDELGFDWLLGGVNVNRNSLFAGGGSSGNGTPFSPVNFPFNNTATIPPINVTDPALGGFEAFPAQQVASALGGAVPLGVPVANAGGGGPITSGLRSGSYAVNGNSLDRLLRTGSSLSNSTVAPGVLSVAGVFTEPQFQTVLRALSQKKGTDLNASPSVTTKSGVKALVEITREFIYPTEYDPPQLPQNAGGGIRLTGSAPSLIATPATPTAFETRKTGVQVEVEPVISEDGKSVEITIAPDLTDFEGFVNYGSPILSPSGSSFLPLSGGAFAIATDYFGNPLRPRTFAFPFPTIIPLGLLGPKGPGGLPPLPQSPVNPGVPQIPPFPYVGYPPPGAPAPWQPFPPNNGVPLFLGPWWITHDILRYLPLVQPERLITPNQILQPVFKRQKVSTSVKVWDGQTVVLGGVKRQDVSIVNDSVPILGNLPIVGGFFRSNVKQTETKNIIIFVTVDVIDPSGQKINPKTAAVSQ